MCYNSTKLKQKVTRFHHFIYFIEYYHYNDFLDAVEAYEIDLEDNRIKAASDIVKKVSEK